MNKLKKQFLELKQNMPKRTRWLLLAAALVIVLILLTLMISDNEETTETVSSIDNVTPELNIVPKSVALTGIEVGSQKTETITITSNLPVKIISVESEKASGLSVSDTCTKMGQIDSQLDCTIMAKYAPDVVTQDKSVFVTVKWYDAEQNEDMVKENKIKVDLSAVQSTPAGTPFVEEEPEPKPEPKPEPEPEPEIIEETVVEEKPVQQEIKEEIETIAPAISFEPEPVEDSNEACSDFAFPGYDNLGQQIGWIKPEAGTYKFHPFSDKDCDSPTGIYNPDTGLIMSISNRGERIGSDAEHVEYNVVSSGILPELSNAPEKKSGNRARQLTSEELAIEIVETSGRMSVIGAAGEDNSIVKKGKQKVIYGTSGGVVDSTQPYDRSFVLRQFKPIPATIVSDVRADAKVLQEGISLPVRATVDRNVYSDNGRTIILPTGTLMLGYVTGEIPGPYKTIGRMEIKWYQFIRPDGVEFNFKEGEDPFSGDAQGRVGVPGRGSSDYLEQFVMPMLTAIVPAAVNLIAPISDKFVNQIDLDNNTVVQSGTVRSSELAKNEIVTAWNQVAQKLLVDMMDNTVPPFTIAAGTRITVYSPKDLRVVCTDKNKKCYVSAEDSETGNRRRDWTGKDAGVTVKEEDPSWTGQVRSFAISTCCDEGKVKDGYESDPQCNIYDYRTLLFYCQSSQYKAINNAKQEALWANQQSADNKNSIASKGAVGSQQYNEEVLGLTYDEETGAIQNPFNQPAAPADAVLTCEDGTPPDANGCCTGETYTDMGDAGFNCCPPDPNADCFPPLI